MTSSPCSFPKGVTTLSTGPFLKRIPLLMTVLSPTATKNNRLSEPPDKYMNDSMMFQTHIHICIHIIYNVHMQYMLHIHKYMWYVQPLISLVLVTRPLSCSFCQYCCYVHSCISSQLCGYLGILH